LTDKDKAEVEAWQDPVRAAHTRSLAEAYNGNLAEQFGNLIVGSQNDVLLNTSVTG